MEIISSKVSQSFELAQGKKLKTTLVMSAFCLLSIAMDCYLFLFDD